MWPHQCRLMDQISRHHEGTDEARSSPGTDVPHRSVPTPARTLLHDWPYAGLQHRGYMGPTPPTIHGGSWPGQRLVSTWTVDTPRAVGGSTFLSGGLSFAARTVPYSSRSAYSITLVHSLSRFSPSPCRPHSYPITPPALVPLRQFTPNRVLSCSHLLLNPLPLLSSGMQSPLLWHLISLLP